MSTCKFCRKEVNKLKQGYCSACYNYFVKNKFDTWNPSNYGEVNFVKDENSKQYLMPVCHICGKAFDNLQRHIVTSHDMCIERYLDMFGLEKSVGLTKSAYERALSTLNRDEIHIGDILYYNTICNDTYVSKICTVIDVGQKYIWIQLKDESKVIPGYINKLTKQPLATVTNASRATIKEYENKDIYVDGINADRYQYMYAKSESYYQRSRYRNRR